MPKNPYPVLGPEGYLYDPAQKIEAIFADYIAAKHSQTIIFHGQVQSLSYDEYEGEYNAVLSAEIVKRSLEELYNAYFDNVEINVIDNAEDLNTRVTEIQIQGTVTQDGKEYRINEVLNASNGKIKRLAQFN